jgi:metallo-beta-lactamase class B
VKRPALPLRILALLILGVSVRLGAATPPEWTRPFPPFRIAGNLYYVGSEDLAAFLIVTPQGSILINSNLASSPAQIRKSVEALGFKFSDVKILLISHGHYDHTAGSAEIKKLTGARFEVMDGDVPVVESGGRNDFQFSNDKTLWFPPAHVNRTLHDGDVVSLGGTVLIAHKTAGHTKGTTTWTLDEKEAGRTLHVVIVGSPNVLDSYKLTGNKSYPQIADDFRKQFATLKALPCDVFLGAHGAYFDLKGKYDRLKGGEQAAFIDPFGYRRYLEERERAFDTALKRQQASGK